MLKRRRFKTLSDDDWNEDESRDASFAPKHTVKRARKKTQQNASISSSGIRGAPSPHSKLVHTIQDPTPMRTALLNWFQTVHANREMPWRKPYDPNLGIEDRAQRAYEVLDSIT
jgi:A/G-specific adenine glycosylase